MYSAVYSQVCIQKSSSGDHSQNWAAKARRLKSLSCAGFNHQIYRLCGPHFTTFLELQEFFYIAFDHVLFETMHMYLYWLSHTVYLYWLWISEGISWDLQGSPSLGILANLRKFVGIYSLKGSQIYIYTHIYYMEVGGRQKKTPPPLQAM
jgi:hypothetical protein